MINDKSDPGAAKGLCWRCGDTGWLASDNLRMPCPEGCPDAGESAKIQPQGASAEPRPRECEVVWHNGDPFCLVNNCGRMASLAGSEVVRMIEAPTRTLSMDKPLFDGADIHFLHLWTAENPTHPVAKALVNLGPLIDWAVEVELVPRSQAPEAGE